MNKENKSIVTKAVKIAGVTCIALGGTALIASGAALKAVTEGAKYLKDTVEKIVRDESDVEEPVVEVTTEEAAATPMAEAVAEEADFAVTDAPEAIVSEDHA